MKKPRERARKFVKTTIQKNESIWLKKCSRFIKSAPKTKALKNRIDRIVKGFFIFWVTLGNFLATIIPRIEGTISIFRIVTKMAQKLNSTSFNMSAVSGLREPHKLRLKGSMNTEIMVEIDDILTDRAVFPLEKFVKKFERFPPGQLAIKITPRAILGWRSKRLMATKAPAGNRKNCVSKPTTGAFGL